MSSPELRRVRTGIAFALGASAALAAAAPVSCLYPDYTFNELEPSGSGSGSGSSGGGTENCSNGADDDSDGAVDCADTDCGGAGYSCVAGIPLGWSGYQTLFVGADVELPACPSQFPSAIPYLGKAMPTADPAVCSACACSAPIGEVCDLPDTVTVIDELCANAATAQSQKNLVVPAMWDGACQGTDSVMGGLTCNGHFCNRAVKSAAPAMVGGMCDVSGGVATKPDVVWAIAGKACGDAPPGGGCDAGKVCQPAPSDPFEPGLCIYKAGEQACPGDPFTEQHVLYEGVDDTRACNGCSCGAPGGGSCTAMITVFTDGACTPPSLATFTAGGCINLSANPTVTGRTAPMINKVPGTCAATGGEATGMVVPTQPTTFCCIP